MLFSDYLEEYIQRIKVTKKTAAKRLEISESMLYQYLDDKSQPPPQSIPFWSARFKITQDACRLAIENSRAKRLASTPTKNAQRG